MKAHVEQVRSERERPWQETYQQTTSDFQRSQREIDSQYGHLIDSKQRQNLDTIIQDAEKCKQQLRELRNEYGKIGEVAIGTNFDQKMEKSLEDFQQATSAIESFQNELEASKIELNGRYEQYKDMYNNPDRYHVKLEDALNAYHARVIDAEKDVHKYVIFQEDLKRISEANSGLGTS